METASAGGPACGGTPPPAPRLRIIESRLLFTASLLLWPAHEFGLRWVREAVNHLTAAPHALQPSPVAVTTLEEPPAWVQSRRSSSASCFQSVPLLSAMKTQMITRQPGPDQHKGGAMHAATHAATPPLFIRTFTLSARALPGVTRWDLRSANSITLLLSATFSDRLAPVRSQGKAARLRDDEVHQKKTSEIFFFPPSFSSCLPQKRPLRSAGPSAVCIHPSIHLCVFLFVGRKWSEEPYLLKTGAEFRPTTSLMFCGFEPSEAAQTYFGVNN